MKKLLSLLAIGIALSSGVALAQEKARTPQHNKMAMCNKEATGKTGDERKGFMKTCLGAGKDLQQSRMKACNAEASSKRGNDRKVFMGECLKKA